MPVGDMQQMASWDKILTAAVLKTHPPPPAGGWMLTLYKDTEPVCLFFISDNTVFIFETHGIDSLILYSAIQKCVHSTKLFSD